MSGPTDLEEKAILDTRLDRGPSVLWIGLLLVMPADDGTGGTEVSTSGTAYARVAINASMPGTKDFALADSSSAPTVKKGPTGSAVWAFPAPTGSNWGDTVGMGIWDASSGGNLLWTAQYTNNQVVTINAGDPAPQFDSSHQVTFQCGDPTDPFT